MNGTGYFKGTIEGGDDKLRCELAATKAALKASRVALEQVLDELADTRAERDRYMARLRLTEERNELAAQVLRGEGE